MIGKVIKSLLDSNANLTSLVPIANRFPYIINENTPLPAIIYTIDDLATGYDKDGWVNDEFMFSVVTFSEDYTILQNIIAQIRIALELKSGTIEGITINKIYLEKYVEGYNIAENVFVNRLSFITSVKRY